MPPRRQASCKHPTAPETDETPQHLGRETVVNVELINTGRELMLGQVLNTHHQWLARQLAALGLAVSRQVSVDDRAETITEAVREALTRADLVLTTGGLGPTSDDRTRDAIARLLGRALHPNAAVLRQIEGWFAARKRVVVESTKVQALVPEGAAVLLNAHGTAPGLVLETAAPLRRLIMLPGPPRELQPMFRDQVIPLLRQAYPAETALVSRTLKTTGMGESLVEEALAQPLLPLVQAGLELGYCARIGEVDVHLLARGESAARVVEEAESLVRTRLGELVFGTDNDTLEGVIVKGLAARRQRLATAESCTGGLIAHRLTNVPGASEVFFGGVVSYANAAKQRWLEVPEPMLGEHGAVSEPVARAMAEGVRRRSGADYALAVTGIAGPSGGTEAKPVGTVFVALAAPAGVTVVRFLNAFDRETFKWVTSQQALDLLRRAWH
jgi:nicotinamide-nucleotide amidase